MSDWGDEEMPVDEPTASQKAATSRGRVFGVDVGGLAGDLVDQAVKAAVSKQVADVARNAVQGALTEDVIEQLRERAEQAAAAAVTEQVEANEADQASVDGAPDDDDAEEAPQLYFGSVDEFVREYLSVAYSRAINGRSRVWAARWWEHDEAVIRLEALWRSWEFLRRDPATGMSVWWRDHADHHMGVLMDPDGPFAAADPSDAINQSRKGERLPYAAPPEGLFVDVRAPQAEGAG